MFIDFMEFPTIDAHFWVERDGKIIDPEFSKDDAFIRSFNNTTKEKKYHEAPEIVQKVFCAILTKHMSIFDAKELVDLCKTYTPAFAQCHLNAFIEWKKNGGRLVFGSQGYVKKSGGVWWEYGNPEWTKVSQFKK
jgi:hypothetical protein